MPPRPYSNARATRSDRDPIAIDLALQGGGAHGAFTWGVIERLFDESWLEISSITGTSAGAMNAVVLAHGYALMVERARRWLSRHFGPGSATLRGSARFSEPRLT